MLTAYAKEKISENSRKSYPVEVIKTGLEFLYKTKTIKSENQEPIRSLLVYQIIEIKGRFLPLNREYKPIGLFGYNEWVNYENYDFLLIDNVDIKYLKEEGCLTHGYFLFDDSTYPRTKKLKDRYRDLLYRAIPDVNPKPDLPIPD